MIYEVEVSEQADSDLRGIFEYIAFELQSPENASGQLDRLEEQCEWYRTMFEACKKRPWLCGFALWEWAPKLPSASEAWKDDSYEICEKPVQEIIKRFYEHEEGTSLMEHL